MKFAIFSPNSSQMCLLQFWDIIYPSLEMSLLYNRLLRFQQLFKFKILVSLVSGYPTDRERQKEMGEMELKVSPVNPVYLICQPLTIFFPLLSLNYLLFAPIKPRLLPDFHHNLILHLQTSINICSPYIFFYYLPC